ncbi:MAG TPA: type II secretion system minor pseudopilin GspK [Limnobacter sp.]|uniref:type II secretion system minor pseudopilin GspK n=1 Tax=Limnobacter sp. TaxID=2003368 RepID=UPI002E2F0665|nr:type II secretion system minor pseudopilin GspK [Limnobacter sp.]HEX5486663.1 type II secretion system minor pseudopilin GspK [Limnobacter sp.]
MKQRGAAVIMALFIVVLCTLAISPLIWNLFATAKTVSVSAARDQTLEVTQSAVDWARVILREDARVSATDNLTEPWAVPLAESRLSEGLMRPNESSSNLTDKEAVVTGRIEDAQGRFNLRNLGLDNSNRAVWLLAFAKLCDLLGVSGAQQKALVDTLGAMYPPAPASTPDKQVNQNQVRLLPAKRWQEFDNNYGVDENTWTQLRPYVVILPDITPLNANTASAELLYACIEKLGFPDAQQVVARRERVPFKDLSDLRAALNPDIEIQSSMLGVKSDYFLVEGSARIDEALVRTQALLERKNQRVYVMWRQ